MIAFENLENHEDIKIPCENNENYDNLIFL